MTNAIPLNNGRSQPDSPQREHVPSSANPSGGESLRKEYTGEEVAEIIRVALQTADDGDRSIVNQEEMLAIAEDLGLSAADLVRASEVIAESRRESDRASKAMQDFRLHLVCYVVGIVGLFVLNWAVTPQYWWFWIPMIAYGPVVAVHGYIAKYRPDLAIGLLRSSEE